MAVPEGLVVDGAPAHEGEIHHQKVHARLLQEGEVAAVGSLIRAAVVALGRLGPVVEGVQIVVLFLGITEAVLVAPAVLLGQLGDVIGMGHGGVAASENGVEPHGVADTDEVGLFRNIETVGLIIHGDPPYDVRIRKRGTRGAEKVGAASLKKRDYGFVEIRGELRRPMESTFPAQFRIPNFEFRIIPPRQSPPPQPKPPWAGSSPPRRSGRDWW